MSRYIEVNALMNYANNQKDKTIDANDIARFPCADVVEKAKYDSLLENSLIISEALQKYQTADVVEVVRCKDCKWYDMTDPCGTLTPNAHRCKRVTMLWFEDDAYCSYGERRDYGEVH